MADRLLPSSLVLFIDTLMFTQVQALTQGPTLNASGETVDCGAMTMGVAEIARIEKLVQQAVDSGARLLAGGKCVELFNLTWMARRPYLPRSTTFLAFLWATKMHVRHAFRHVCTL